MDALMLALIGCLVGEIGDKSQLLVLLLALRFRQDGAIFAGIVVAAVANAAVSAAAGMWIAPMLGSDARLLFLALAILFLGGGMLWRAGAPDPLAGWRTGPFWTTALGLFILGFGDGPQFLILGITAWSGNAIMAGIGGAIGVIVSLSAVLLIRDHLARMPLKAARYVIGILLVGTGGLAAVSAGGLL